MLLGDGVEIGKTDAKHRELALLVAVMGTTFATPTHGLLQPRAFDMVGVRLVNVQHQRSLRSRDPSPHQSLWSQCSSSGRRYP